MIRGSFEGVGSFLGKNGRESRENGRIRAAAATASSAGLRCRRDVSYRDPQIVLPALAVAQSIRCPLQTSIFLVLKIGVG